MFEPGAKGVIFDMDGVLVDSFQAHFESWRLMGHEEGVEITESQFAATFGQTSREIIRKRWTEAGRNLDEPDIKRLDDRKEALFREIIGNSFPSVAGSRELVSSLRAAGFVLGVGSSAPPENVDLVLDRFGGRTLFDAVVNGMEVARGKPDPEVFLLVARRMGIDPSRCAVIEDAVPGIEAAHRAGMAAVAYVSTGRSREEFQQASADLIVQSLSELTPEALDKVIARPS
ncbi:MAG: HAD family hydrolase [Vicinamibacterales bacterium]